MAFLKGFLLKFSKPIGIGVFVASLLLSGCGGPQATPTVFAVTTITTPSLSSTRTNSPTPTKTGTPTVTPSPTPEPYLFTISQEQSIVSSGQTQPLQPFQPGETRPFPEGYLLTTDAQGEALLQGRLDQATCRIYVFLDTQLRKRPCSESTYEGGNASCVEAGSAVYQDCDNHLAMTPSGEVEFQGTWVQVMYLPDQQVSIFIAAQGEAQVRPVTDVAGDRMGAPVTLTAGQFLYTAPDDRLNTLPDLPVRQALSVDRLPALLPDYPIMPWIGSGFNRISPNAGTFPSPDQLTGPPDLVASLEVTGPAIVGGRVSPLAIPVRVTVTNRGGEPADIFKLSVNSASQAGTSLRPFITQANQDGWYPFSTSPLPPGGQVVFDGQVGFNRDDLNKEMELTAVVDSCAGEEFTPPDCRVSESDENNNTSQSVTVLLSPYP